MGVVERVDHERERERIWRALARQGQTARSTHSGAQWCTRLVHPKPKNGLAAQLPSRRANSLRDRCVPRGHTQHGLPSARPAGMRAMWHRTLFIHRQDLRLHDNIGLHHALTKTREVVHPVFILDPCQCDPEQNKYFGVNSFHFIVESIAELENEVPVTILHGTTPDVIDTLLRDAEAAGNA